jgi:hypothetical protein
MSNNVMAMALLILLFTWPAYVLPIIIGPVILRVFAGDPLGKMAGVFTLKPLVATPIWALIVVMGNDSKLSPDIRELLTLIPGIGLTLILVLVFRRLFETERNIAFILLGADALRWLTTFVFVKSHGDPGDALYVAALIMPNAYAVLALVILWLRSRQQNSNNQPLQ